MPIKTILTKYWGYSNFRPLQEDIINSVLAGKDTLALMPTGGGKSICYQIPGIMNPGICIVISPLIALMKDQVEKLNKKGIKAFAIYSGMTGHEIEIAYNNCVFGNAKFLYISPERLSTSRFKQNIENIKVNLLAIDEAHCISQWGYDFRPDYLKISDIRNYLPGVPVLALTATAKGDVITDIQQKLNFKQENVFRISFERKNLIYFVIKEEDKLKRLLKIANKNRSSGIVYVRSRRKTKEISEFLTKNNISSDYYHAGLSQILRNKKQQLWMNNKNKLIVCTNAFGMGIDKSNVRFVVHFDLPDSIESYFQEAGRAGRDGQKAFAVLLYNNNDIINLKKNFNNSFPDIETIKNIYDAFGNYLQLPVGSGKNISFDFNLSEFSNRYNFSPIVVYNSIKFLEKEGYITFNESIGSPSLINILTNNEILYKFQVEHPSLDKVIKIILRSYTGLFSNYVKIDEFDIANKANTSKENIIKALIYLDKSGIIKYIRQKTKPQIIFLLNRLDKKDLCISSEKYRYRKEATLKRLNSIIDYATSNNKCRSQQLLAYFGENNTQRCGKCDVCLKRNKISLSQLEFDTILKIIKPMLKTKPRTISELADNAKEIDEDKIIKTIQWLLDNNKIYLDERKKLFWKK
ncbi:MAG: RecQ family ATP-dependent DNA helicase [Bacteroidales bacterium]|nr:RecQ family ATP-dependent DNA helicase [Bacteroidales bacterium]